ncbi:ABC transporter substrate-binding protein [Agrobacterium sp. NPDC058088]|uniref:ABC transporter substrate-binding protein n=1 Tax=Agrobacterium sp. NPDC058088 TaxID=3346335 RepID=UPI0036DB5466
MNRTKKSATTVLGGVAFCIATCVGVSSVSAADKIKVGVLASLEGPLTALGEDGVRGFQTALKGHNAKAGGREIDVVIAASDATPDSALRAVRKLVEQDKVDIVIGPVSGDEGIAVKEYAKTHSGVTFINGDSAAQETTFPDPAPNYFRFNGDGAQWMSGLADYIYNDKGYKSIAVLGDDYSFPYTQVFGLTIEYCSLGGKIEDKFWAPLGAKDYSSIIAALPDTVDAIFVALGGSDAVNFTNQYQQAGGTAKLIGGAIMVDQTVLSAKGEAKKALLGTVSSGQQADTWDNPKWQAYVKAYQDAFPADKRFPTPSGIATGYYNAALAAFTALDTVKGDLSDGHKKFRETLSTMTLDAPNGEIKLDKNRQAVVTNFVTEVVEDSNGNLVNKLVKTVPNVTQTLGMDAAEYTKIGAPTRNGIECKKYL